MFLTRDEERMLDGDYGEVARKCMEIIVAIGEVFEAKKLIGIKSAHISGISYKNIGDAGIELLRDFVKLSARASVSATTNPAGMDLEHWQEMGIPASFAEKQLEVTKSLSAIGVKETYTCTPYLSKNRPSKGEHLAWAESSAVVYANSVLGARTNRESGISALASAIVGKTPLYGMHLDECRVAKLHVQLDHAPKTPSEYSLIGYMIGSLTNDDVVSISMPNKAISSCLKALSAGLATSGRVSMFTINSKSGFVEKVKIELKDIERVKGSIGCGGEDITHAFVGCPHASLKELKVLANLLKKRRVRKDRELWVFTSRTTYRRAESSGLVSKLLSAGVKVFRDTCMVVAPLDEINVKSVVVDSAKAYHYIKRNFKGIRAFFADTRELVDFVSI